MFKACGRCGKIHDLNYKCTKGKIYSGGQERTLRATNKWKQKSLETRENANWICEVCRDRGRINYKHLEVHHIEKLKDREDLLLDEDNLVVLCHKHHQEADAGILNPEYLRGLAEARNLRSRGEG